MEQAVRRPRGLIRFEVRRRDGELIYRAEYKNLFVNAGLPCLAALFGGTTSGQFASVIGFGSGSAAPTVGDTGLTTPAYYKSIDSASEDGDGDVTFAWSLGSGDTNADGITIQELGLFANTTSVSLPGTTAPVPLLARRTIAPIAFVSDMNISGSWGFTF